MIDILRKSTYLKVSFLTPFEDGSPRRGQDDSMYSLYAYLSTCSSLNERLIDSAKNTPLFGYGQANQHNYNSNYSSSTRPSLSTFSPQKQRHLTVSSNITKIINRLSASSSLFETNNSENPNQAFNNNLYAGFDHLNAQKSTNGNENSYNNANYDCNGQNTINKSNKNWISANQTPKIEDNEAYK